MVELNAPKQKLNVNTENLRWPLGVSVALFFTVIAVFIGFKIYLNRIQADIVAIDQQVQEEIKKVSVQDENLVIRMNESIGAFKNILENHSYFSNVLDFISSLTYAKTYYERFDADLEKNAIQIKGTTQNYSTLAKQIVAIRDNKSVQSLEVSSLSFSSGGVNFGFLLTVDSSVFTKK